MECAQAPEVVKALSATALEKRKISVETVKANTDFKALALKPDTAQTNAIADAIVRCVDGSRSVTAAAKRMNAKLAFAGPATACLTKSLKTSTPFRDSTRNWVAGKPDAADSEAMAGIVADVYVACGDVGAFVGDALLTNDTPVAPAESACMTKRAKASAGITEALTDLVSGSSLASISDDDAAALGDVYIDCADVGAFQAKQASENNSAYKATPAAVSCLTKAIRSGTDLRRSVRSALTGHDDDSLDAGQELEAYGDCEVDYYSRQEYLDAYTGGVGEGNAELGISPEAAKCLGEAFLETYTVFELERAQISPEDAEESESFEDLYQDVTDSERAAFTTAAESCLNISETIRQLMRGVLESSSLPATFVNCAVDKLAENPEFRGAFVTALLGNPDFSVDGEAVGEEAALACASAL